MTSIFETYGHGSSDMPWWILSPLGWQRRDGAEARVNRRQGGYDVEIPGIGQQHVTARQWNAMEDPISIGDYVDKQWPAAFPGLTVGQVWASPDGEVLILAVARGREGVAGVVIVPDEAGAPVLLPVAAEALADRCLVAGLGAPWAPPGWAPELWMQTEDDPKEDAP